MALLLLPFDLWAQSQRVAWRPTSKDTWPTLLHHLPSRLPGGMWSRTLEKQVNGMGPGGLGHRSWHQGRSLWPGVVICFSSTQAILERCHPFSPSSSLFLSPSKTSRGQQRDTERGPCSNTRPAVNMLQEWAWAEDWLFCFLGGGWGWGSQGPQARAVWGAAEKHSTDLEVC